MNRRTGRHCRPVMQLPRGQLLQLSRRSWRTWNEQGQSKLNGGKNDEGSGHGMAKGEQANIARRTRPLQANTASR